MSRRTQLAAKACHQALRLRAVASRPLNGAICPFDFAEELGVEVRFVDIPSLEALYINDGGPKILISAGRPSGRQRFSCAHEIGHHVFGHGTHFLCTGDGTPRLQSLTEDEYIAQVFAGFLLLPKAAVSHTFRVRGWSPGDGIGEEYYVSANALGVSFAALVTQCVHLGLLSRSRARTLSAVDLPHVRSSIAARPVFGNLIVVDQYPPHAAADIEVGDLILTPLGSQPVDDAMEVESGTSRGVLLRARRPGVSAICVPPGVKVRAVRITRSDYVGRAVFRHLEDPDFA